MQVVIKSIIHDNQVGYIKGRNISTIIRTIDDVIEFIKYNYKTGVIVGLDYSKAFDSINKQFLVKSFEKFGFGPYFIKWVEVLMNDTQSSVQHSGWLSEWFPTECGIRQGCPFSPLSFILAVELLAVRIRQSGLCSGIHLPEAVLFCSMRVTQTCFWECQGSNTYIRNSRWIFLYFWPEVKLW